MKLRRRLAFVTAGALMLVAAPAHAQEPLVDTPAAMQMDDSARFGTILLDQLEWRQTDTGPAGVWEAEGWYGGDHDKLWLKTEGEQVDGLTEDARAEAFWDRAIGHWWDLQLGAREDFGFGPPRSWAALGLEGLARDWVDLEATVYLGEQGRTAARVKAEYDIFISQRLIVQPEAEANLYGKSDPARRIGSGLSELDAGIRARYEIRRELAPYIGVAWQRRFGETAGLARTLGQTASDVQFLAGLRLWF